MSTGWRITKTGNKVLRTQLIESAWHYRSPVAQLIEPYAGRPASVSGGSAATAPPTRPRRARVAPAPPK